MHAQCHPPPMPHTIIQLVLDHDQTQLKDHKKLVNSSVAEKPFSDYPHGSLSHWLSRSGAEAQSASTASETKIQILHSCSHVHHPYNGGRVIGVYVCLCVCGVGFLARKSIKKNHILRGKSITYACGSHIYDFILSVYFPSRSLFLYLP